MQDQRNPLMTVKEVAGAFGVEVGAVKRWLKAGKLATVRLPGGRLVRCYTAEVEALLRGEPLTPEQIAELRDQLSGAS